MKYRTIFYRYLQGKLDMASNLKFECQLEHDEELAKDFELYLLNLYLDDELNIKQKEEVEHRVSCSHVLRKQMHALLIERYLNGCLSNLQENNFRRKLQHDHELKKEFDIQRLACYASKKLKGKYLHEFEDELKHDPKLSLQIGCCSNSNIEDTIGKFHWDLDYNKIHPEDFLNTMDKVIEEFKERQLKRTPKQKIRDKVKTLEELEKLEKDTYIDTTNPFEIEMHKSILKGIRKEKENLKTALFIREIEKVKVNTNRMHTAESFLNNCDKLVERDKIGRIHWFPKSKVKRLVKFPKLIRWLACFGFAK